MPEETEAHPAVLGKLAQLVAAGGTVIGPKPSRAVGLEGYPASDETVRALSSKMWGDLDGKGNTSRSVGKGRIIWGKSVRDVLDGMGIAPDFGGQGDLDFIHRRDGSTDLYFVRNTLSTPLARTASFRVSDREPEVWDPVTGKIEVAAAYTRTKSGTDVPLDLAANGSVFVVFRRPGRNVPGAMPAGIEHVFNVPGPWAVSFEAGRKAPESIALPQLISWTKHEDPGVKFFSGTARYKTSFTLAANFKTSGRRVELDLGNLWTIGEAWLNGQPLGILWTVPFRVECTGALREGTNELVVEVTNTWFNRLVGDASLPAAQRITRMNVAVTGGRPWASHEPRESGLFGPVRILARD
jgi:hypothetical protein